MRGQVSLRLTSAPIPYARTHPFHFFASLRSVQCQEGARGACALPIKLVLKGSDAAFAQIQNGQASSRFESLLGAGSLELMKDSMSSNDMAVLYAAVAS